MAGFKISNDVGATVFALLSGLSALFLTAWIFGSGGCRDTSAPKITPVPVATVATEASGEVDAARKALAEESARRAELANKLRESKSNFGSLEKENAELHAEIRKLTAATSLKEDLTATVADLNLKLKAANERNGDLTAKVEEAASARVKLDAEIADLQAKLKASGEGAGKMAGLSAELAALKLKFDAEAKAAKDAKSALLTLKQSTGEKEKALLTEIESLKGSMSGDSAKISAELKALKLSSADKAKIAEAQVAKLKAEVDALTKKLTLDAKACEASKKRLMGEINKLNGELDSLKNGDKLKRAGDFPDLDLPMLVNDPLKLDSKVRPLFISLRGINETAADRKATYEKIIAQGNSNAKDVVQFDSGSSEVTAAERKELETKLKALPKGAKVLAVGYASIDGDAKSNYELSSKRASSVAQEVARITGLGADNIQAVYFGQTKRFDEKVLTPNRVVEVWVTK
ncbi:MAG: OmpA family protein [Verrucomicrobiales bacterium]|nr:OmpA family protein [Verrucomicrobiales bacterium]